MSGRSRQRNPFDAGLSCEHLNCNRKPAWLYRARVTAFDRVMVLRFCARHAEWGMRHLSDCGIVLPVLQPIEACSP